MKLHFPLIIWDICIDLNKAEKKKKALCPIIPVLKFQFNPNMPFHIITTKLGNMRQGSFHEISTRRSDAYQNESVDTNLISNEGKRITRALYLSSF